MAKKRRGKSKKGQRQLKTQIHNAAIIDHLPDMTEAEVKLYLILRMFSNWNTGWSCPSRTEIMKKSGLGRKAIETALEGLAERRLVIYEFRRPRRRSGVEYGRARYFYKVHPTLLDFTYSLEQGKGS